MSELTAERLREVLDYDPETGLFRWKVRLSSRVKVGYVAGSLKPSGYVCIKVDGRFYLAHRLAWLHIHGVFPVNQIDHINCSRSDNRIANIREVTNVENHHNQRSAHIDSKTGLLGVDSCNGKFRAQISIDGNHRHLGMFNTPEEAHAAYLQAKRQYHSHCTI